MNQDDSRNGGEILKEGKQRDGNAYRELDVATTRKIEIRGQ